ncbi:hypothetical protein [Actinoplanes sp. NPDC023714]|uniref:hypothetical protein n=1 Tax=Actinoplanes sp. NPDC023714 TaxID=3154322 RepID=UPI0033C0D424
MTFVHVAIHQVTHICPANPEPHVVDTRRVIVALIPGGPCRQPINVRLNDVTVPVACGRRLPTDRQCPACKVIVIQDRDVIITHLGYEGPQHLAPRTAA